MNRNTWIIIIVAVIVIIGLIWIFNRGTPTPVNPLGAKGIGESGSIGSTPAVQNAVVDALSHLGVRHVDLPCSPERVWSAIAAATGRGVALPSRKAYPVSGREFHLPALQRVAQVRHTPSTCNGSDTA